MMAIGWPGNDLKRPYNDSFEVLVFSFELVKSISIDEGRLGANTAGIHGFIGWPGAT
jgi:hypothetical protein